MDCRWAIVCLLRQQPSDPGEFVSFSNVCSIPGCVRFSAILSVVGSGRGIWSGSARSCLSVRFRGSIFRGDSARHRPSGLDPFIWWAVNFR
jgi:hypothetical protein